MRRAPGWQGALRTSVSCLPVNAALAAPLTGMLSGCRCRGQTLRVLDSNPLQFLLYFLVLLDAAVVIAEILIDLHAMRSLCSTTNTPHTIRYEMLY